MVKYFELNFFRILTVDAKRREKLVNDILHFFSVHYQLEEINCTFQLHALCVRARTMYGREMHLVFCYNEF